MSTTKSLATAIAAFLIGAAAHAAPVTGQISLSGYAAAIGSTGMGGANGVDFVQGTNSSSSPGVPGGLTSYGGGSGSFAGNVCANSSGSCGVVQDILNFSTSAPIANFLVFNLGSATALSFDLGSITNLTRSQDPFGGSLSFTASGLIHLTGRDDTPGEFRFTAQGNQATSFSATLLATRPTATVPEPESMALLALGAVAFAASRRKPRRP